MLTCSNRLEYMYMHLWGRGLGRINSDHWAFGRRSWGAERFLGVPGARWRAVRTRCMTLQYFSDFSGPVNGVDVSNPDALGAFCQSKYPGPGAPYFAFQGRKPGTKLPL